MNQELKHLRLQLVEFEDFENPQQWVKGKAETIWKFLRIKANYKKINSNFNWFFGEDFHHTN